MSGSHAIQYRPVRLDSLELGRAVAALAVVAHHAAQASDALVSQRVDHWFHAGALGVDFFFVLSGFIIYHVHHQDPRSADAARRFLNKRLRRIYVPYLPIALALMAAYTAFPGLSQGNRDWGLLTSLTLLPTHSPPALSVAWTLVFEMVFYLCFLCAFFLTRHFWRLVSVWAAAVLAAAFVGQGTSFDFAAANVILHPLILEFIAGMVAAMLFNRSTHIAWTVPTLLGTSLLLACCMAADPHRVFFGFAFALLALGAALAERRFSFRVPAPALLLGAASYAIYLVHNPIASAVARIFDDVGSWWLTFMACCLCGVVGGILYHLVFERPAIRWLASRRAYHMRQYQ